MPWVLNMPKPWIRQYSQYASVTQRFEYAIICLHRVLNISRVLDMSRFWVWQGSEYARVTHGSKCSSIWFNMSKFMIIDRVLNIHHAVHSTKSPCKLMSAYWEISVVKALSKISKIERFGKIIIAFNYFRKTVHVKSLRGFWICVWF